MNFILLFSQDSLLIDIYLARHVKYLYTQIRNRALCQVSQDYYISKYDRLHIGVVLSTRLCSLQYFSPYVSADMNKMAVAFNTTVSSLENELMQLILDGQINARIDSHNKVSAAVMPASVGLVSVYHTIPVLTIAQQLV